MDLMKILIVRGIRLRVICQSVLFRRLGHVGRWVYEFSAESTRLNQAVLDAEAGNLALQAESDTAKSRFGRIVQGTARCRIPCGHAADSGKQAGALFAKMGENGTIDVEGPKDAGLELCRVSLD